MIMTIPHGPRMVRETIVIAAKSFKTEYRLVINLNECPLLKPKAPTD